jgi:hypothetical protein
MPLPMPQPVLLPCLHVVISATSAVLPASGLPAAGSLSTSVLAEAQRAPHVEEVQQVEHDVCEDATGTASGAMGRDTSTLPVEAGLAEALVSASPALVAASSLYADKTFFNL